MSYAFIFPGQASQSLKMMDDFVEYPIVRQVFSMTKELCGEDYLTMLQDETADRINQTINTQPLMFVANYAIYQLWRLKYGKLPDYVAGHSLGEWSALVASEVLTFAEALALVRIRAKVMQDAVPQGSGKMAVVLGLADDIIINVCNEVQSQMNLVVEAVNFNAPNQVVIAGDSDAVIVAMDKLKNVGARKVQLLPVSVPSHCSLLKAASERFADSIAPLKFRMPQIPIMHNVDATIYQNGDDIKQAMLKQLYMPVLWSKTINNLVKLGCNIMMECGPGKVLTGLNKRINPKIVNYSLHDKEDFFKALEQYKTK